MTIDRRTILAMGAATLAAPAAALSAARVAHDFRFTDIDGAPLELAAFRGRPMMIVNTASRCGFTYQYDGLQALWDRYRDAGFVLIGVPSDDFGGQELATEARVKDFCAVNFAIDFPMTEIVHVRGDDAHPFYPWAIAQLADARPRWNFHKILISADGSVAGAFGSNVKPRDPRITTLIETLLADARPAG